MHTCFYVPFHALHWIFTFFIICCGEFSAFSLSKKSSGDSQAKKIAYNFVDWHGKKIEGEGVAKSRFKLLGISVARDRRTEDVLSVSQTQSD